MRRRLGNASLVCRFCWRGVWITVGISGRVVDVVGCDAAEVLAKKFRIEIAVLVVSVRSNLGRPITLQDTCGGTEDAPPSPARRRCPQP